MVVMPSPFAIVFVVVVIVGLRLRLLRGGRYSGWVFFVTVIVVHPPLGPDVVVVVVRHPARP